MDISNKVVPSGVGMASDACDDSVQNYKSQQSAASGSLTGTCPNCGNVVGVGFKLTPRDWEILACVQEGCTQREVSARMKIDHVIIKSRLHHIYNKLRVPRGRDRYVLLAVWMQSPIFVRGLKALCS